jgi:cell division protein FtsI (penicillin-binding protein 3)
MSSKKEITWRFGVVYFGMLLLGFIVIGRVAYLQWFDAEKWIEKARKQTMKYVEVEPNRGDILDCNGQLMVSSIPYYEVRVDLSPKAIASDLFDTKIDSLSICLSKLFGEKSASQYRQELTKGRKDGERYYLIHRRVSYLELKKLKTFPIFRLGKRGGLILIENAIRFRPYNDLASRTIGYLTQSESGNMVGIEGAFDKDLAGVKIQRLMQKVSGNLWIPVDESSEDDAKDGLDVVTTLDMAVQDVAEAALMDQLRTHNAHHGSVIVMEVKTGEIKAIANLERNSENNYQELYNYAIGESTEPGSTFKLPVLMSAFEDGLVSLNDSVNTTGGTVQFHDKVIRDSHEGGYGVISVQRAFELSSNTAMSKIITSHYKDNERKFIDHLYKFHLNEKLGVEINGEGSPYIKYPGDKFWSGISLPMIAHGYEVKLTPLQLLTFYNAVANDGKMIRPQFVKELKYHGTTVKRFEPHIIDKSICSSSTLRMAKTMLEGVVQHGTAMNLNNTIYKIAGKTGTAQIAYNKYGYKHAGGVTYQASFCGYFPADDPKYSCIVVVSAPSNSVYYGNLVAGPVFRKIADKVYATSMRTPKQLIAGSANIKTPVPPINNGKRDQLQSLLEKLGINYQPPSQPGDWISVKNDTTGLKFNVADVRNQIVPDVTGMGARDAVYLLENTGLKVSFRGYGKVKQQSITPGSKAKKGERIVLTMQTS